MFEKEHVFFLLLSLTLPNVFAKMISREKYGFMKKYNHFFSPENKLQGGIITNG